MGNLLSNKSQKASAPLTAPRAMSRTRSPLRDNAGKIFLYNGLDNDLKGTSLFSANLGNLVPDILPKLQVTPTSIAERTLDPDFEYMFGGRGGRRRVAIQTPPAAYVFQVDFKKNDTFEEVAEEIRSRVVHRMAPVLIYLYNATPEAVTQDFIQEAKKLVTHFAVCPTLGDAHSVTEGLKWLEAATRGETYTMDLQPIPQQLPPAVVPQNVALGGNTAISVA